MCGICGIYTNDQTATQPEVVNSVRTMSALLQRRGPDDERFWVDPEGHVQFGFRRLAIIDLSPAGHQPMISHDERSVLIFNGEMYNFLDLRRELEDSGIRFRSQSDSEVVLEALNCWGISALERFNGMFALALYDRHERQLLLARDHAGIKPLYYSVDPHGRGVIFASQFNCLLKSPWGPPGDLREDVLHLYLRLHHIPPPYTLMENAHQLEPGHYVLVRDDGSWTKAAWWTLPRHPEPVYDFDESLEALEDALDGAVTRQRIADVPLGVFLSGGVDSPLVTAIARQQTDASLKAFTIGNPDWWQDEADAAAEYAKHLDIDHRVHNIQGLEASQLIDEVIAAQGEPFGDYSIIPTLLVSQAARKEMTVALSGDGGDELFWGYERPLSLYRNGTDFRFPHLVRLALYGLGKYSGLAPRSTTITYRTPGDYYFDVNSRLKRDLLRDLTPGLSPMPEDFSLYDTEPYRDQRQLMNYSRRVEFYGQLQRGLKKVDMASMYHSLEVRVPLLDRDVIEVSLRMNPIDSLTTGLRKPTLRQLLGRYVPPDTILEAKRGFAIPLGEWLRSTLRDRAEAALFDTPTVLDGMFDQQAVRTYWNDHLEGRKNHKWGLWTILSLKWWAVEHLAS